MKLGVVLLLGVGIIFVRPELQLPAFTRFVDGTGPDLRRQNLPVLLHHHRLRRHLRLPRADLVRHHAQDDRQGIARLPVGYGSMLLESFVAIMAMVAACVLQPGVYFAVNSPAGVVGATPAAAVATISAWGFPVTAAEMAALAQDVGEQTLFYRTGGAPSLALGMAHIFARDRRRPGGDRLLVSLRHHVRGAVHSDHHRRRHARWPLHAAGLAGPCLRTAGPHQLDARSASLTSAAVVGGWGYFLIQGVRDPLGGINSLWPLVRHRQSVAGGHRALRGHHHSAQNAWREIHVDHLRAASLAGHGDVHRGLAEDLLARSGHRVSGPGRAADGRSLKPPLPPR